MNHSRASILKCVRRPPITCGDGRT